MPYGASVDAESAAETIVRVASEATLDSLPLFDAADVGRHNTEDSKWVVVDGFVYDVTNFKHPGGDDKLFDNAGTDVSKLFKSIKHSPRAFQQLRVLLVGRLASEPSPSSSPATGSPPRVPSPSRTIPAPATALAPLDLQPIPFAHSNSGNLSDTTARGQGRASLKAGQHPYHLPARPGDAEPLWSTRRRGFLPSRDPLRDVGHATETFRLLLDLVARLPTALAEGTFRELVLENAAGFAPLAAAIKQEASTDVLERVHGLYGYIGKAYVHGVVGADGAHVVPSFLAEGWYAVAGRLGRHPTIDYASCVLYNWERIEEGAPLTPENIRLLNRFTGLLDEEWFLKTHVIIESEAAGVIRAVSNACKAIRKKDYDTLLAMLGQIEQSMSHVATNCLWIMFERSEDEGFLCEPDFFFHRFRPYISTWTALFEGQCVDRPPPTLPVQLSACSPVQLATPPHAACRLRAPHPLPWPPSDRPPTSGRPPTSLPTHLPTSLFPTSANQVRVDRAVARIAGGAEHGREARKEPVGAARPRGASQASHRHHPRPAGAPTHGRAVGCDVDTPPALRRLL